MVKFKDTDFLHAASRVKSLERNLLTSRQLLQMVEAHGNDEAYKIVNDAGIGVGSDIADYEQALKNNLLETYELLTNMSRGTDVFNIFRYEYDGLNLKVLIKAQAMDKDSTDILTPLGTVPCAVIAEQFRVKKFEKLHPRLVEGALEALETLAKTSDPQIVDIIMDKSVLAAMHETGMQYDNKFIRKYVATKIDISNIRCMIRIKRIDAENDFFRRVVAPGGTIDVSICLEAYSRGMDAIIALIEGSSYGATLEPGLTALRAGSSLSLFEKLCDNYMIQMLGEVRLVPFGIEPLIAYLCAKENEVKAARIVLASRMAGVAPDQIKERLRESYA